MRISKLAQAGGMVALAGVITMLPAGAGAAGPQPPSLKLMSVVPSITATRYPGDPWLYVYSGMYAAATNGPFELNAVQARDGKVSVYPVRRDANGTHRGKALVTPEPVSMMDGLPDFFDITVVDPAGNQVASATQPFCPGSWVGESRVDASGPDKPTYPYFCGSPMTRATVWGIDRGWASTLGFGLDGSSMPDGTYTMRLSVNPTYVRQFGMSAAGSSLQMGLTVTTDSGECKPDQPCAPALRASSGAAQPKSLRASSRAAHPALETGPHNVQRSEAKGNEGRSGSGLPNLAALPAHDMSTSNEADGRDYLNFAATIWNAGPGPLVVEGFRNSATPTMPATQFFYHGGSPTGSKAIGSFEYDTRPGHNHWHFEDAAQYDLLDAGGQRVQLSGKQSFCLAPTDPIDLNLPGADWQPDRSGLWSQCADEDSIWLREVLPSGWGDTYYQDVAGQSFDITDLPNGRYQLRVTTNPRHRIQETSYADNSALVTVELGGTPGNRSVTTP